MTVDSDERWDELIARLRRDEWRAVYVLGATDAGKTTFCHRFASDLCNVRGTAWIDCDPGQTSIGPPTTLGLDWYPWTEAGAPLALRFVGATSPRGYRLQTVTGVRRLADRAGELGVDRVVIDAAGDVHEGAGREMQYQIVDLIRPDHLIALQKDGELEPLLSVFGRRRGIRVHRLPVGTASRPRSAEQRKRHRKDAFARYFRDARMQTLPLQGLGLHGNVPRGDVPGSLAGRLVALCDDDGFVVTVGTVEGVGPGRRLRLYAPAYDGERVCSVQVGVAVRDL